jgi:hypothetical protein
VTPQMSVLSGHAPRLEGWTATPCESGRFR